MALQLPGQMSASSHQWKLRSTTAEAHSIQKQHTLQAATATQSHTRMVPACWGRAPCSESRGVPRPWSTMQPTLMLVPRISFTVPFSFYLNKVKELHAVGTHLALDLAGIFMVHCAAHADAGAQDLLHGALELPRAAAVPHDPRYLNDRVQLEVAAVLDVLLLQPYLQCERPGKRAMA